VRGVVLAPTRELALQIKREFDRLAGGLGLKMVVLSKANLAGAQSGQGSGGPPVLPKADIIITTPLRLATVVASNPKAMETVTTLVLDEADQLFEMGFVEQVASVLWGGWPSSPVPTCAHETCGTNGCAVPPPD